MTPLPLLLLLPHVQFWGPSTVPCSSGREGVLVGVGCRHPDGSLVRVAGEAGAGFSSPCCRRAQGEALKQGVTPRQSASPEAHGAFLCFAPGNCIAGLLLELHSSSSAFRLATPTTASAPLVSSLGQQWCVVAILKIANVHRGVFLFSPTSPSLIFFLFGQDIPFSKILTQILEKTF